MERITTASDSDDAQMPRAAWLFALAAGLLAYFFGLSLPFVGPDEPRYAQVAREMLDRGDWITPTLGGAAWLEKPALLYWVEIVFYKLFGVTEFAARLGPALLGLGIVLFLFIFGRIVRPNTSFPYWLALIGASTLGILVFAHGASFDIVITFAITASVVSFFAFDRTNKGVPLVLFYVFCGAGLLAKGLIGIVFPIGIVFVYHAFSRKLPSAKFVLSLVWGCIVAVAVAALWYLPMYWTHGYRFIDEFIIQHHFQRFTSNKYQHPQPFYFFFWVLPLMTLPWLPFFVLGTGRTLGGMFRSAEVTDQSISARTLAIAWVLVPLVFFSFSGSKLPGYILPAVPGAIVLAAYAVYPLLRRSRAWRLGVYGCAITVFLISSLVVAMVVPSFADSESVKRLIDEANAAGHADERVFCLHTISHSAEFYAAGRLLRDPDGTQKKLYSPMEVRSEMEREGANKALILVPLEYATQVSDFPGLISEKIADNHEFEIVAVSLK